MGVLKPARREFFAQNLAKGMNQTEAHAKAGYKPRRQNASNMAKQPEVIERVKELRSRLVDKVVLSKNYVLDGTIENFEKAIGRRPVKLTRRYKQGDEWITEHQDVYVYEGSVAIQTLKALGSEVGLFTDRKELKIVNEYSGMSDKELAQKLVEIGQQALLEGPVIEHEASEDEPDGQ